MSGLDNKFYIEKVDTGRCSLVYKTRNEYFSEIYYCLLQDLDGIALYRCSEPFKQYGEYIYEPQSKCTIKAMTFFQVPMGESKLEKECREFILNHNLITGF